MSEKYVPKSFDKGDSNYRQYLDMQYRDSLLNGAEKGSQRYNEARAYDEHMRDMADRGDDKKQQDYEDLLNQKVETGPDAIDRAIASDSEATTLNELAIKIAKLQAKGMSAESLKDKLYSGLHEYEKGSQDLESLANEENNGGESTRQDIVYRILERAENETGFPDSGAERGKSPEADAPKTDEEPIIPVAPSTPDVPPAAPAESDASDNASIGEPIAPPTDSQYDDLNHKPQSAPWPYIDRDGLQWPAQTNIGDGRTPDFATWFGTTGVPGADAKLTEPLPAQPGENPDPATPEKPELTDAEKLAWIDNLVKSRNSDKIEAFFDKVYVSDADKKQRPNVKEFLKYATKKRKFGDMQKLYNINVALDNGYEPVDFTEEELAAVDNDKSGLRSKLKLGNLAGRMTGARAGRLQDAGDWMKNVWGNPAERWKNMDNKRAKVGGTLASLALLGTGYYLFKDHSAAMAVHGIMTSTPSAPGVKETALNTATATPEATFTIPPVPGSGVAANEVVNNPNLVDVQPGQGLIELARNYGISEQQFYDLDLGEKALAAAPDFIREHGADQWINQSGTGVVPKSIQELFLKTSLNLNK